MQIILKIALIELLMHLLELTFFHLLANLEIRCQQEENSSKTVIRGLACVTKGLMKNN